MAFQRYQSQGRHAFELLRVELYSGIFTEAIRKEVGRIGPKITKLYEPSLSLTSPDLAVKKPKASQWLRFRSATDMPGTE